MVHLYYFDTLENTSTFVGFNYTAEGMVKLAWEVDPAKLDQEVLKECNITNQIWYTMLNNGSIIYQSSIEKLKGEYMSLANYNGSSTENLNKLVNELSVHRHDELSRIDENNRRSLWVGVYRDVFESSSNLKRAENAKSYADKAVAAYDEQFAIGKQ